MTLDMQEALSRRYGKDTFSALVLSSGKLAIIGRKGADAKAVLGIVDCPEAIRAASATQETALTTATYDYTSELNLPSLDLSTIKL